MIRIAVLAALTLWAWPKQDEIVWLRSLKKAQAEARESGKPMFVVFR
jgi:hypothetical protein